MTHNGEADEGRDIVDETSLYTLAGTDEGWGVWDRSSPSERPAVFYPPTDDGFELAVGYFERANSAAQIRRGPWTDVLRRVAFVAGGVWIATVTIANLWFASDEESIPGGIPLVAGVRQHRLRGISGRARRVCRALASRPRESIVQ